MIISAFKIMKNEDCDFVCRLINIWTQNSALFLSMAPNVTIFEIKPILNHQNSIINETNYYEYFTYNKYLFRLIYFILMGFWGFVLIKDI